MGFQVGFHVGFQVGFQVECREGFQVGFRVVVDPAGGRPRGCGWLLVAAGMWQWTPRMWMVAGVWLLDTLAELAIGRRAGAAQAEYVCLTDSQQAVSSFLTEDLTDSDSGNSYEVPRDADFPKSDDARLAWVTWLKRGA